MSFIMLQPQQLYKWFVCVYNMRLFIVCSGKRELWRWKKKRRGEWPEQEAKPKQLNSGLVTQQQVFKVWASCSYMLVWEQRLFFLGDL